MADAAGRGRVVIVGASLAGLRTLETLRRRGSEVEVVLVAGEPAAADGIAADRPPLSKAFLSDRAVAAPPLRSAAELDDLGVRRVCGRAVDLDLSDRVVTLHGGERIQFGALVVATGSTPRSVPGLEPRPGAHVLRTAADAAAIREACTLGTRMVVVGGGFIGAEVAWTAHLLGCSVTVVEMLPALMVRGLGPDIGAAFTRRSVAVGIDVRLGVGVAALEGADRVDGVRLTDGSLVAADVVVLGLGTVPETSWLDNSGLDLRDGVICDEHLAAVGAEDVFAVGDVARWRSERHGEDVRVEHWTNAVETATVVARNLTGDPAVHDPVPYVWSDQLGGRLQVFGRVHPQDEVRVVFGELDSAFVAITGGEDGLQAVVGFGALKQLMPYRRLLAAGAGWGAALQHG